MKQTNIPAAIVAAYPDRQWSDYQSVIFNAVADRESGSRIVRAVAGAGKSTTIVAALLAAPAGSQSIFLAFNKAIAEELKARGVNARTFHSLTYTPVLRATGASRVDSNKLRTLVREWPRERAAQFGTAACKLVGLARQEGIGCLVDDTDAFWYALAERHEVTPDVDDAPMTGMVAAARALLEASNASKLVDFDDLLYWAVLRNVPLPRFDLIMVDECQDTNAIQRAILRKIMASSARIFAVGDEAQAIYGFRGADSDSMDRIASEFGCQPMPLTITYRCARSIVAYAGQWSPLEAAPDAPEGEVVNVGDKWLPSHFAAEDLVVCRTNAPLLGLAYRMMRERIPCHVMGRDIGAGLRTLIDKLQGKGIDGLLIKLGEWQDRETAKAATKDNEALAASIADKADCIRVLVEGLPENSRTVPELCRTIDTMFAEGGGVTLASIHKSKGLEAGRVWWLNRSACPSKWAKQAWQQQQELNLCYVAATRAKRSLRLIEMPRD